MAEHNDPTGSDRGEAGQRRNRSPARRSSQGRPMSRRRRSPARGRVLAFLAWWVLVMSLWVMIDDSLQFDELLAGAGASVLAALAAEGVTSQAAAEFQLGLRWPLAAEMLRLPWQVVRDTITVFGALARAIRHRTPLEGEFAELPVEYGDDTPAGETRRMLLTGARSLAPNMFVVGLDPARDVMVVHQLVRRDDAGVAT